MRFRHTAAACALAALGAIVLIAGAAVSGQEQAAEADGFTGRGRRGETPIWPASGAPAIR